MAGLPKARPQWKGCDFIPMARPKNNSKGRQWKEVKHSDLAAFTGSSVLSHLIRKVHALWFAGQSRMNDIPSWWPASHSSGVSGVGGLWWSICNWETSYDAFRWLIHYWASLGLSFLTCKTRTQSGPYCSHLSEIEKCYHSVVLGYLIGPFSALLVRSS